MNEIGIDIAHHRSKGIEEFLGQRFDYAITVCDQAKEACPILPGTSSMLHWSFEDPASAAGSFGERVAVFRKVRDEIAERIRQFMAEESQ